MQYWRRIASAVLVALMIAGSFFLSPATQAAPFNAPQFIRTFGEFGEEQPVLGGGPIQTPRVVTTDSAGNIYVTEETGHRVQKLDSAGNYLGQWGGNGSGNGQFKNPLGIVSDSSDNIYVVDRDNNRIQKFDSHGNYLSKWGTYGSGNGQFRSPRGIAIDSLGNFYVSDADNVRIQKFDSNGNYLTQWGSISSTCGNSPPVDIADDGRFCGPQGMAVDQAGSVYVVDTWNHRIQKFDSNGNYLSKWGSLGSGNGQFNYPTGIVADGGNNLYIIENSNHRVQKFDNSGNYLAQWGDQGSGNGQFYYPWGIGADNSSNIYVADTYNNRIQKFSSSGTFINEWNGTYPPLPPASGQFNEPSDIVADNIGNTYIVDRDNHRVQKFDSTGTYLAQWGSQGSDNGQFNYPAGIAIDSNSNIYVTDAHNDRVQKFDNTGTYLTQWGSYGSGNGQFDYPRGIAIDSNNNIYITDSDNNRIQKFDSAGAYLTQWGSQGSGNGQFDYPWDIAIDSNNNIYITDTDNSRIQKFDSTGNYLAQWGDLGSGDGQFSYPSGIAVDRNNNSIYVADIDNDRVQKFDSAGTYLAQWGSISSTCGNSPPVGIADDGRFCGPMGLTVDRTGLISVVDTYNHRVQVFGYPARASLTGGGGDILLEASVGTAFSCSSVATIESLNTTDSGYEYPLGLVRYCLQVLPAGSTTVFTATFQTSLAPGQVTARKYNPNTNSFGDVAGASVVAATLNGQPALRLTYAVTDGGPLDIDGVANGVIEDPVGLAVRSTLIGGDIGGGNNNGGSSNGALSTGSGDTLAPTGSNLALPISIALALLVLSGGYLGLAIYRRQN